MKRYAIIFIVTFYSAILNGQVHKYWMMDTANVACIYDTSYNNPLADTMAFMKWNKMVSGETYEIFWDKSMKHIYSRIRHDTSQQHEIQNDTTWYRNGRILVLTINKGRGFTFSCNLYAWYPDGAKLAETTRKGNEKVLTYYYNNGKIKRIDTEVKDTTSKYIDAYIWAYTQYWCINGTLLYQDSINSRRRRIVASYYCNGNKRTEWTTNNNVNLFGKYREWYDNGQIQVDGQYDDSLHANTNPNSLHSKKQGKWSYYNESGKLTKEEWYKDGAIINEKKY